MSVNSDGSLLGLYDFGARYYDPVLGRWFNPDPALQGLNPYVYCGNNPVMYIDKDGRIAWLIPVIMGIIGGTANVLANIDNIHGFWEGFTSFLTAGAAAAGACFTAGWSAGAIMGYGAGAGATISLNNSIVAQTGKNFEGFNHLDWGLTLEIAGYGALSGAVGAGVGTWASSSNMLVNNINSPMLRSMVVAPLASGAAQMVAGTTAGVINGQEFGDAFKGSFKGMGGNMLTSAMIAGGTTVATSYARNISPFTGRKIYPTNNGFIGKPTQTTLQPGAKIDRYGDSNGQFFAPEGTPIENRSLHPSTNTTQYSRFEVLKPPPCVIRYFSGILRSTGRRNPIL